ncbi:MAG: TIGR01212 family radical SAM protein [Lachnospiraceae bacterium]|nr:TIGR01212 family radical SAM protein [Lachnospiraceae bacterium]MBQ6993996.1 TIGR01212 family radical SAM protein [Lachnospiraceae bacterium]
MNNKPTKWGDKPYHSLNYYLKNIYGEKIYKIALDAGMTCPNRDGKLDTRGCIFCSAGGSGDFASHGTSIREQLENGKKLFHDKKIGSHFIAYFQSFTNTYAEPERLKYLFEEALAEPEVIGISIATRPDCLEPAIIELLSCLKKQFPDKFIWIELGLQTIHEQTALYIRRGYPLAVFEDALAHLHAAELPVIVHVILGLPGETKDMMLATCRYLSDKKIFGIKLQLLHVLKNTDLATDFFKKSFEILAFEEYIDIIISCLELLPPDVVIHRVTGDGPKELLIEPTWSLNKRNVLNTLHKELRIRETFQGRLSTPNNINL